MKKSLGLALGALLIVFSGCTSLKENKPLESKLGVLWVQNSGEYEALAYQAFNSGKTAFLENKINGKNAVVVDLDETMINNSGYAAWQVENSKGYSSESWTKWCEAKEATAIPGAVDFANFIVKNGGDIFYISNRHENVYNPTMENLKALGFPQVDSKHLLLKNKTSDKAFRVDSLRDQGYKIVLMVGDNLDDFGSDVLHKTNMERVAFVKAHKNNYGNRWIVLPNPMYGGFQTSDLTLKPWNGK
ncbi:5'-nucleotidase, lipoprotein e(P4) family [Cetobacterium ceti]|uniref:5'-nucleotidase, lipoprotein e(P4) family n=1 Tax=Cetobacterium ceti TaxID=180163 RepID=A0A1T4LY09_9FUSO|nr:5'-nucleotidase, lipoprotein e(P4) family [Cetobacterium ceti]SJZ59557.1 5'-nucleotidase, lipoprotein e(P4) family [Cetobacterium ceti]